MKSTRNAIGLLALCLFLVSCTHGQVGREFEFDSSKKYSLVAYDIYFVDDFWPNFGLYLFPYDQETKTIQYKKRYYTGSGFISGRSNEGVEFYLGTMDPGTYVVGYLYTQVSNEKSMVCFPEQTMQVGLKPGQITYFGEMTFTLDHPRVDTMKLEVISHGKGHVAGRMAKYHMVNAEINIQPVEYVSFDPGEIKGEQSCIWDYVD